MLATAAAPAPAAPASATRAETFTLPNGLMGVVIPDHRAPVVTNMVWYRVGAADEPTGKSGIAHFLEHLMFKATDKIPAGDFSKIVSRLGGQDNAFTSSDTTAYFQRVAKERLGDVMAMEADRMVNLKLDPKEVDTERNVILEERRMRIDSSPAAMLDEQMTAALYQNHHYRIPVIGWLHEMAGLTRDDALAFYKRYYGPANAILVVTGDVTVDEVKALAEKTFGKIGGSKAVLRDKRPSEPPQLSPRQVSLTDGRAGQPMLSRYYQAPSYSTAKPGDAEAIDILMKVLGGGSTSRLYQKLVVKDGVATSVAGYYSGGGLDGGKIVMYGVPSEKSSLDKLEAAIDALIAEVKEKGVTAAEVERAKNSYIADYVYETDSQSTLARRYGWGLAVGETVADIEAWPERIAKVTVDDVKRAAGIYLDTKASVTGRLIPDTSEAGKRAAREAAEAAPPISSGVLR